MSTYRSPNPVRMQQQSDVIFTYNGFTATWRHLVSATSGNPAAGIGAVNYYSTHLISALFANFNQPEDASPAGMLAAAQVLMTTREQVSRGDEIVWRGVEYDVDSDPVPARNGSNWIAVLKRVSP